MSANDLADRLDAEADLIERRARGIGARVPDSVALDRAAAALLREQAEQLDTLRTGIEAIVYGDSIRISAEVYRMLDALLAAAGGGVPETKENPGGTNDA